MNLSTKQKIILIFCAAILLRVFFVFGLWHSGQPTVSLSGDAAEYIQTAKNFLYKGIWSVDISANPVPDNVRTPVYPFFLSLFFYFKIPLIYARFFQDILMGFAAVLVYCLGRKIFPDKTAFIAALVIALEPYLASTFVSGAIMNEVFAILFLVIALLSLGIYIKTKETNKLFIGSLFFAILALTKPQFFFFGLFIPLAVWFAKDEKRIRKAFLSLAVYFLILSPWLYYNFFILKVMQFSWTVNATSYFVAYCRFMNWKSEGNNPLYNSTWTDCAKNLTGISGEKLLSPEGGEVLGNYALKGIKQNIFSYSFYHFIHIPRTFYHDTTVDSLVIDFGFDNSRPGEEDINVVKNALKLNFNKAISDLVKNPLWIISLSLQFINLILGLLALSNFFLKKFLLKEIDKVSLLFILFIALYAFLVSPVGLHRYRVPLEPIILLLALDSFEIIRKKYIS